MADWKETARGEPQVSDPRTEATSILPAGYEARVLEPSPPASTDPDWWADDPTLPAGATGAVVTPIPGEGRTWDEMIQAHPDMAGYARARWLTGSRRLPPLPRGYAATRTSLHQFAFFALAPKRQAATGKMGLRHSHRGFGTPFFGDDEQLRFEGDRLVHQSGDRLRWTSPTTLGEACDFIEITYREQWFEGFSDPLQPIGPTAHLLVDETAARFIGDWFGFATLVLERFRRLARARDATRVQLWPEHFDVAIEIPADGHPPPSYGASPGDADHPEPHLYVAPQRPVDRHDAYWNDLAFEGASLPYRRLLEAPDPVALALDFLWQGHQRVQAGSW